MIATIFALGAGGETFTKSPKVPLVGPNPSAIAATDLNGDGLTDIVTANSGAMTDPRQERPANDELSVLIAAPGMEYTPLPPLRTDFAPYGLAIGNIDALKAPDIVAVSFMSVNHQDLAVFRNMGESLFEPSYFPVPTETLPYKRALDAENQPVFTKPGLTSVILVDANKDGFRDAIATGWSSDVIVYYPGAVEARFEPAKTVQAADGPRDLKAADFDRDGNPDLAVVLYSSSEIGLWKGNGTGAFDPVTRFSTRGKLPTKIEVADLNRDGNLDLVVSHCHTDDSVVVFYGDGSFSFSASQEILLGESREILEQEIRDIAIADFNGDERLDIASACYGSGQVILLTNDSDSSSIPLKFTRESYPYENGKPRALCVADFNQDTAPDLGVTLWNANVVAFLMGKPAPPPKTRPADPPKDDKGKKKVGTKE